MQKHLFILLLFYGLNAKAQYKPYPKLEKLYKEGKYEDCIEKANSILSDNIDELYPYVWQIKCYLMIDENEKGRKTALNKALSIALKLKKKDKDQKLEAELLSEINELIQKQLNIATQLCENNLQKANELFIKLIELRALNSIKFKQYKCLKNNNYVGVETMLKNILVSNYQQFKNNHVLFENMDYAYAELMEVYYQTKKNNLAQEVESNALEVYPNSILCIQTRLNYLNKITFQINEYSSEQEIIYALNTNKYYDSMATNKYLQQNIYYLQAQLLQFFIKNEKDFKSKIMNLTLVYFNRFNSNKLDSLNQFYNTFSHTNNVFNYWIKSCQLIANLPNEIDAVKQIAKYFEFQKNITKYQDYIAFCKIKYNRNKIETQAMQNNFNILLSQQIIDIDIETLNKYAEKTNNKAVKEKQYSAYIQILNTLLVQKNFSAFAVNCRKALSYFPNDVKLLNLKKQFVIEDYKTNYIPYNTAPSKAYFTTEPNTSNCNSGKVNTKGNEVVLTTINYVRRLAGVADSCYLDEKQNAKCQKAALMMSVNNDLKHHPPKKWKCYTDDGATASGSSNLSLGHSFNYAIMGQIEDDGIDNFSCGHRRWLLNPYTNYFGHGSTYNATSIYVFGSFNSSKIKNTFNPTQPVMWPSADYFPLDLIPQRWSFSLKDADFENAKVTILENGQNVPISIEKINNGYGLNTLVWQIQNIKQDKIYIVNINNVKIYEGWNYETNKAKYKLLDFSYKVIPIKIE